MNQPSLQRDRQGVDYEEEQNVQKLHAAIRREQRGGLVTIKPFSLRVLVICGIIFFFAGFFLARRGADFTATNVDRGNPPAAQSNPQAVQTGTASAGAVQSTVADANAPLVVHVAMKNMKFSPATIEIKKGDTVEWKNDDITPHTATSAAFDSGSIASDAGWRHTFTQAGSFPYYCTFHPEMKGTVVVK
ncbi:MAG TPA: cupredoxin family copper-binding protein [Candidatus Udaeobacter sp.]|nr:cupredoxin family copper-binding protein [Candidatus Udaeobacter sp.]